LVSALEYLSYPFDTIQWVFKVKKNSENTFIPNTFNSKIIRLFQNKKQNETGLHISNLSKKLKIKVGWGDITFLIFLTPGNIAGRTKFLFLAFINWGN